MTDPGLMLQLTQAEMCAAMLIAFQGNTFIPNPEGTSLESSASLPDLLFAFS